MATTGREKEGVDRLAVPCDGKPGGGRHRLGRHRIFSRDPPIDLIRHGRSHIETLLAPPAAAPQRVSARHDGLRRNRFPVAHWPSPQLGGDHTHQVLVQRQRVDDGQLAALGSDTDLPAIIPAVDPDTPLPGAVEVEPSAAG